MRPSAKPGPPSKCELLDHELLFLLGAPVVPDAGARAVADETAIRGVAPPSRAEEVHVALEGRAGVVVHPRGAVPQRYRVAPIREDIGMENRDAGRSLAAAHGELMVMAPATTPVIVSDREVRKNEILDALTHVDDGRAPVVRMRLAPLGSQLGEDDARPFAVLPDECHPALRDEDLFPVGAVSQEDDPVGGRVRGKGVESLLDRPEVSPSVLRDDQVCSFARPACRNAGDVRGGRSADACRHEANSDQQAGDTEADPHARFYRPASSARVARTISTSSRARADSASPPCCCRALMSMSAAPSPRAAAPARM